MDGDDDQSSVIIDTKVAGSVPVLTKKQREDFMKRKQGIESGSDDGDSKNDNKNKKSTMKAAMNLQE